MSANGGQIVVQLQLEDGQYKIATINAGNIMREFKRTIEGTATSVKRLEEQQMSLGRRFRDLVLTLGNLRFVAMDINDIFLRLPMSILKTAGEMERLQQLMTGLSKETEQFQRKADGLKDFNFVVGMAKNAPFEISSLADSFVKLKTAGIDPTNGSMSALVDSVARFGGTGETLKRASVAIQQMAGKGVISMEELRQQLGEAVPSAMKSMADGMGMDMQKLTKIVSTGTLVAGPALAKMLLQMRIENKGAAAEMMTTWTGMTAQLKTEWELSAKYIADSGFGDAAKKGVGELIEMLRSDEFRKFGREFGQVLGELVTNLGDTVKFFVKFREEITTVAQAWLAYKVVFSGVLPGIAAITAATDKASTAVRKQYEEIGRNSQAQIRATMEGAAAGRIEAEARELSLAQKLATDQKELASVRVRNAAILSEAARTQVQLKALQLAEVRNNANNIGEQQSKLRYLDELSARNRELLSRQRELTSAVDLGTVSTQRANEVARAKAQELGRLNNAMTMNRAATMASTVANTAWLGALNLVGGGVNAAIIAIMALIYWYDSARRSANALKEAQDRALNRSSTEEDRSLFKEKASKAQTTYDRELAESQNPIMPGRNGGLVKKDAAKLEGDKKRLDAAKAALASATTELTRAELSLKEKAAEDVVKGATLVADRKIRDMESLSMKEVMALSKQRETMEKSDTYKALSEKERLKKSQEFVVAAQAVEKKSLKARIDYEKSLLDSTTLSDPLAQDEFVKQRLSSMKTLQAELQNVEKTIATPDVYKAAKEGGAKSKNPFKDSPLQQFTENLAEQKAALLAEIAGFGEVEGKADSVAGVLAKVQERLRNGDFDVKAKKNLKPYTPADTLQLAADVQGGKIEIDRLKKEAEELAKLTSFVGGQRPEIEAAMELIADPLGTARAGRNEKKAAKWVGENVAAIQAQAEATGKAFTDIAAEIIKGGKTIDDAKFLSELEMETKQLNDSLVEDTRQAARARAQADNERHRQEMQNIIDLRKAKGASDVEIAQMQTSLDKNQTARTQDVAKRFQSPLEKLANDWKNTTGSMEQASVGWANKTADAFTELAMTGKTDFHALTQSIIADLIKIGIQKALVAVISSATSFFAFEDGGIMSSMGSAPLKKYASGGIANSPQLAMFGEGDMPEAYVPLPDGRSIPVTMSGSASVSGASAGNVAINITVHQNGSESSQMAGDNAAAYKVMGERIKQVVREEIIGQQRPGGILYK